MDTKERSRDRGVGADVSRPDGVPKVQGRFAFSSDLWADNFLWGHTLRSPHPSALISNIDIGPALAFGGVHAVLLASDVPGQLNFGLDHQDQPVLAADQVRYVGEPVALVAAEHPDIARRAAEAIVVNYEVIAPLTDSEVASEAPPMHPDGNVIRRLGIRHGDLSLTGEVVVEGSYEVGMQDQAFMGPESGMALPEEDGGVELFVSTQWLHVDRSQIAACLGLAEEQVRITLAGVGGAFGAREDLSLQVHLCLLAQHTQKPVKMVYSRDESFLGHVHRHPAKMWYRHHADRQGHLIKVEARIVLDGGAYASSSAAVIANASCFAAGPYKVLAAEVEGLAVRTNNPPCGAMRGFGAVQTCFAHEAQMDKLAAALGMDPVELRLLNALAPGDRLITGQVITGAFPVAEVIRQCAQAPSPVLPPTNDYRDLPGGSGRTTKAEDTVRGTGFAVGFKNLMFSEGFDDYSSAACRVSNGVATITCACAEVGQGFVTLAQQIARTELSVDEVILAPAQTVTSKSAGSTSASRQTWMSGGAVQAACRKVREQILSDVGAKWDVSPDGLVLRDGMVVCIDGQRQASLAQLTAEQDYEADVVFRHVPTQTLDENGQGNIHVSFACAAHRVIVDVDPDLGLVRVRDITTAQDVGRILNPTQALGQIEGGIAQGVGLALMEEIVLDDGLVRNNSFTDYVIPTTLDMPEVTIAAFIEEPEPGAPYGAKGIGEPPTISSSAAVAAAVRDATGLSLERIPIRPYDIALADH
ncbi:MAG: xanthine dehydrogenase subunit D [Acidimicrobiia bacterium]|nr:xanthine dehydrogenase subunit D [Acidimicrobiia bacterium]MYC57089.1 xanthine dehydrogenase subunit D [Acidimicrobiia bacterium]MYI30166.1 xanthine dehydrogenase subunit D [Acidimicrobiia bacterium]